MHLPVLEGVIRRRLLVNFRVRRETARAQVPSSLRLDVHGDWAHAGICLIRLEHVRPACSPIELGLASENVAHRYAVHEDGGRQGVFVARRDTDNLLNHLAGGRMFPGVHGRAKFRIDDRLDASGELAIEVEGDDGLAIAVRGRAATSWPRSSVFASLDEASEFYARGVRGWSPDRRDCLEAIDLQIPAWRCQAFEVDEVRSSHFDDLARLAPGSVEFDHALLMRDVEHSWHAVA